MSDIVSFVYVESIKYIFVTYINYVRNHFGLIVTIVFDGYIDNSKHTKAMEQRRRSAKTAYTEIMFDGSMLIPMNKNSFCLIKAIKVCSFQRCVKNLRLLTSAWSKLIMLTLWLLIMHCGNGYTHKTIFLGELQPIINLEKVNLQKNIFFTKR